MMKTRKRMMAYVLSLALLLGMMPAVEASAAKKASLSTKKLTVLKGKSKTLTVKNTKKKVTWKILSGKKHITIKKKGKAAVTVTGRKEGRANVQAKIGKKKLTCTVIVKNAEKESTKPAVTSAPPTTTPPMDTKEPTNTPLPTNPANTSLPANPTNAPMGANEQDVEALKALITEQRGRGATVSEDLSNSEEYVWKDGRLTEIHWNYTYNEDSDFEEKFIKGDISFSPFTELQVLECGSAGGPDDYGELTSFDITNNVKLIKLNCRAKLLKNLDVSKNVNLIELDCSGNDLTSLDVTNNVKLERLETYRNYELDNLDVSKNVNLKYLECMENPLTSLDVTNNVQLEELGVIWCKLTNLDVSRNVNLKILSCIGNQLTSLNVSGCTALEELYCSNNQLKNLDVSKNINLKELSCIGNQLKNLDVSSCKALTDFKCDDNVTVIGYDKKDQEEW